MRIRNEIHEYDDNVYMILEHLGDNSEETVLANAGMMPWGNINHEYNEASMGYGSNLNWADFQNRNWQYANLVSYAESHDEERLMYKNLEYGNSNGDYDVQDLATALERQEAIAAFLIPLRGPKMIDQNSFRKVPASICTACSAPSPVFGLRRDIFFLIIPTKDCNRGAIRRFEQIHFP